MSAVEISYKGSQIASMDATGVKTLLTGDTFCEDDIVIQYTAPSAPTPTGTKQITISGAGTVTEDVTNYASVEVTTPAGSVMIPIDRYITANPTITVSSAGLITATVNNTETISPTVTPGYVSSVSSGTVHATGSSTSQLTVYTGAHHTPAPSTYTITVSLTNPSNAGDFGSCDISEWLSSDPMDEGSYLGAVTSPTGSTSITVQPTLYGVSITITGTSVDVPSAGISCTGGVSYEGTNMMNSHLFQVTGDGTIMFDGIDYDD